MPTKEWERNHVQVKFWVTPAEFRVFDAACLEAGMSKAEALRQAIRIVLGITDGDAD